MTPPLQTAATSPAGDATAPEAPLSRRPHEVLLGLVGRYPTAILLVVLGAFFSITTSEFLTTANLTTLVSAQSVVALVTLGALMPLIVGEFDLSLGYMVGLLTMLGAYLGGHDWVGLPVILAVLLGGCFIGLVNAVLSVRFKIASVIATLGVGIMLTGFTSALAGGAVLFEGIPPVLTDVGNAKFLGISDVAWIVIVIAIVLIYVLEHTPFGRRLYATGASERVAFLSGVKTSRMKFCGFVLAGVLMGAAGLAELSTTGSASPTFGAELLLPAYAGAFLSVVAYRPGYFNVPGAIIAVALIAVGSNGLSLLGVPYWGQPLFNGAVLVVAVLGARAESRRVRVG